MQTHPCILCGLDQLGAHGASRTFCFLHFRVGMSVKQLRVNSQAGIWGDMKAAEPQNPLTVSLKTWRLTG